MKERIKNHVRAGFAVITVNSPEETRSLAMLAEIGSELQRKVFVWSITRGVVELGNGFSDTNITDPIAFLAFLETRSEPCIGVVLDPNPFMDDPMFQRAMKDRIPAFRDGRPLVLLGTFVKVPADMSHLIANIDTKRPNRDELAVVVNDIASVKEIDLDADTRERTITALSGLTTDEAADTLALSIVASGRIDPETISAEKCRHLSGKQYVKVEEINVPIGDIGGLEELKNWLLYREEVFSSRARAFGLPTPKGILLIGVAGCGKSLTAKAVASVFKIPLISCSIGALMGSHVGESEKNTRDMIQIAESMAPCVLWIDELDKQLSPSSGGDGDSGVSKRVMGDLLKWLSDKTAPVFVVATANNVQALATAFPEMLRKGRWDETFFVDLPNDNERDRIFDIHLQKINRNTLDILNDRHVKATSGFSGAEIEGVVRAALHYAFADKDQDGNPRPLNGKHLDRAIAETVPMERMSRESIESLRKWSEGRARPASKKDKAEAKRRIE